MAKRVRVAVVVPILCAPIVLMILFPGRRGDIGAALGLVVVVLSLVANRTRR
jgi:hypothetical protein